MNKINLNIGGYCNMNNIFMPNGLTYNNVGATRYKAISSLDLSSKKTNVDTFETSRTFEQYMSSAIEGKNTKNSNGRLTDEEIKELSGKFNPEDMTQEQYDEFIDYLLDKGIISDKEASYGLGQNRVVLKDLGIKAYYRELKEGSNDFIDSLSEADGNAMKFISEMLQWEGNDERNYAFEKILSILKRIQECK